MEMFKTLTSVLLAGDNTIEFTDANITDTSILDCYLTDSDLIIEESSQTGTTVSITVSNHSEPVGVALFINNCDTFKPYDDTDVQNELLQLGTRVSLLESSMNNKQDKLTAGENITIENNVISASGGSSSIEYSTVEKKIGKWTDGRDLYQITVVLTPPTSSGVFSNGIVGATQICNYEALYKMDTSDSVMKPPSYINDNSRKLLFESMNNTLVETFVGTSFAGIKLYLTVQYTKE